MAISGKRMAVVGSEVVEVMGAGEARSFERLPYTVGQWKPILRAKGTPRERVVAWIEMFMTYSGGPWVTIPGTSRYVRKAGA